MTAELVARAAPVLAFLVAGTALATVLGVAGLFDVIAFRAGGVARTRRGLLLLVAALATATTVLLGLDAAVVLVTPLAVALARRQQASPWPFAFVVVWLAGTASLLLPVSNLTNLLAVDRRDGDALSFAALTLRPWLAGVILTVGAVLVVHRRDLRGACRTVAAPVTVDPALLRAAVLALVGFVVLLGGGVAAWAAAAAPATLLALAAVWRGHQLPWAQMLPWRLVVAVSALFGVVAVLGPVSLDVAVGRVAGTDSGWLADLRLSAVAALLGNAIDNLPAYLVLERVTPPDRLLPVLLGVNAGTLITPWGSLATLLWARALAQAGLDVPWRAFVLRGLLLVPAVLLVGTLVSSSPG